MRASEGKSERRGERQTFVNIGGERRLLVPRESEGEEEGLSPKTQLQRAPHMTRAIGFEGFGELRPSTRLTGQPPLEFPF